MTEEDDQVGRYPNLTTGKAHASSFLLGQPELLRVRCIEV